MGRLSNANLKTAARKAIIIIDVRKKYLNTIYV